RIVRLDRDLREIDSLQIVESEEDVCHANCIEEVNGELLLSIFTLSPGARAEKNGTRVWQSEGKVLRLDWERKAYEVLFEPLAQPHSLTWRDGALYCCESHTSQISRVNLKTKS